MAQVYSVMLGFLVAATYAQYGETRTWVRQEVESLRLIRNITSDVATPQAEALKTAVSDYARAPWSRANGNCSRSATRGPQAEAALASMLTALPDPDPDGSLSTALAVGQLRDLIQNVAIARVERISAAPDRKIANLLSGVLVLITGLAISIAWFLRGPSVVVHLILGGILVTTFLSLILLSVELIYPFAGDLSIQPDEFRELIIGCDDMQFGLMNVFVRWLAALALMFSFYNPSGRSFVHWAGAGTARARCGSSSAPCSSPAFSFSAARPSVRWAIRVWSSWSPSSPCLAAPCSISASSIPPNGWK